MNGVASLETCKELYELSGWRDTFNWWEYTAGMPAGEPHLIQPELMRRYGLWGTQEVTERYPAYDLGYMRKKIYDGTPTGYTDIIETDFMVALFQGEEETAKLAIELFKQGILTKES